MIRTRDIFMKICNSQHIGHQFTTEELHRLQGHLMQMYKDLEIVCQRHGLQVCLAFGNVIGALRHDGWIPWDDDLDVFMPRKDYELFLTKYADELPSKYKVFSTMSPDGPIARFAKIVDTSSVFVPIGEQKTEHSGVFVDIFPVDNIRQLSFVNRIKKMYAYFLMYTATSVMQVEERSQAYKTLMSSTRAGRFNYRFRQMWGLIFSFVPSKKWHEWIEKFWIVKEDTGWIHVKSALSMCGKPIPTGMIFPCVRKKLSVGEVFLPHEAECFLNMLYGNWRVIPSDSDKWHHYVTEFFIPEADSADE